MCSGVCSAYAVSGEIKDVKKGGKTSLAHYSIKMKENVRNLLLHLKNAEKSL